MNIFLILVLGILFGTMIWGYWRGFIRIAFSLITMVLNIILVSWTTPYITDFVKENTPIYENMAESYAQQIQTSMEKEIKGVIDETIFDKDGKNIKDLEVLSGIPLPKLWIEEILETTDSIVEPFENKTEVYGKIGEFVADRVLRGIIFFSTFLLLSILLRLLLCVLNIVSKLPLLKGMNRLLGGIFGFLQGLIVVWMLLFLVTVFSTSNMGQIVLDYINESKLLMFLYQYNGILYFFYYILQ